MALERKTKTRFSIKFSSVLGIILVFIIFILIAFVITIYYNIALYSPPRQHLKLLYYQNIANDNIYSSTKSDIVLDISMDEVLKAKLEKAQQYININDIYSAIDIYTKLIRKQPSIAPLRLKLAQVLERVGQLKKAEEEYKQAYTYNKNDKKIIIILTDFMIKRRKYNEALFYLRKYEDYNKTKKNIDPDIVSRQFFLHYLKGDFSTTQRYLDIYKLWIETNAVLFFTNEKAIKLAGFLIKAENYNPAIDILIKKLNFDLKNKNFDYELFLLTISLLIKVENFSTAQEILDNIIRLNYLDNKDSKLIFWKNIINVKQHKNDLSKEIKILENLYNGDKLTITQGIEFALILYETKKTDFALSLLEKNLSELKNLISDDNYYVNDLYKRAIYIYAKFLEDEGDIYKSSSVAINSILSGFYDIRLINVFVRNLIRKKLYDYAKNVIQAYFNNSDVKLLRSSNDYSADIMNTNYYLAMIELNLGNYTECREYIKVLEKNNFDGELIKKIRMELILNE